MYLKTGVLLTMLLGASAFFLLGQEEGLVEMHLNNEGHPVRELILGRHLPVGAEWVDDQWQVLENGQEVEVLEVQLQPRAEGVLAALVFDHSSGWAGTPYDWSQIKRLLQALIDGFEPTRDSLMLIGYGEEVDMITEMTDNFELLHLVLEGAGPTTGQALPEAIQTAVEALAPYQDRKAIFVVSSGYGGEGLDRLMPELGVPVFLLSPLEAPGWSTMAWQTGGLFQAVGLLIEERIPASSVADWPYAQTLVRFESALTEEAAYEIELYFQGMGDGTPIARLKRAGETKTLALVERNAPGWGSLNRDMAWLWYSLGCLLMLLGTWLLIKRLRLKTSRNLVQPAITALIYDSKRKKIKAQIDIPMRKNPAKFTLHNSTGTPIRDRIVPGTRRSVSMDVSDLREGVYLVSLSNAGMTSELREVVFGSFQ
jgi:hypothetical protein